MASTPALDHERVDAFMKKVSGDISSTFVTQMCILGDRLGLFKDLNAHGPATSGELARRTGIKEQYAREWLNAVASAGYLEYSSESERFTLPREHAPVLADEGGPKMLCGIHQMLPALQSTLDLLTEAFREGGGVTQDQYDENYWEGMERITSRWYNHLMLQQWLPLIPNVRAKLERGAVVADIGCGRGRALLTLATAFPRSRCVGYDVYGLLLAKAEAYAQAEGVADRVSFRQLDVAKGLPEQYDLIATIDALHEFLDPLGTLKAIRRGLKPDGTYLLHEVNVGDSLEANMGPRHAMFYSVSVLYCLTTVLAHGAEGLGRSGLPESKVRELCAKAGFSSVRRMWEDQVDIVYEIRP